MTSKVTHYYKLDWPDERFNPLPFDDNESTYLDKIGDFEFHSALKGANEQSYWFTSLRDHSSGF